MKLLLDENLPVKLKYRFLDQGLETYTVADKKWNARQNGELLEILIDEGLTHLITFDSSISFQQNFLRYPVPVVIIIAPSNSYATIMEVFPDLPVYLALNL
ncbi:MAG TPA: DUF5615 family PIN-like protein [Chitinophagaceae bacterium]|nr:DUF5615 family PIN-like protein [Chitinophagaceae bacterium]